MSMDTHICQWVIAVLIFASGVCGQDQVVPPADLGGGDDVPSVQTPSTAAAPGPPAATTSPSSTSPLVGGSDIPAGNNGSSPVDTPSNTTSIAPSSSSGAGNSSCQFGGDVTDYLSCKKSQVSTGTLIGAALAVTVGVLLLVALCVFMCHKSRQSRRPYSHSAHERRGDLQSDQGDGFYPHDEKGGRGGGGGGGGVGGSDSDSGQRESLARYEEPTIQFSRPDRTTQGLPPKRKTAMPPSYNHQQEQTRQYREQQQRQQQQQSQQPQGVQGSQRSVIGSESQHSTPRQDGNQQTIALQQQTLRPRHPDSPKEVSDERVLYLSNPSPTPRHLRQSQSMKKPSAQHLGQSHAQGPENVQEGQNGLASLGQDGGLNAGRPIKNHEAQSQAEGRNPEGFESTSTSANARTRMRTTTLVAPLPPMVDAAPPYAFEAPQAGQPSRATFGAQPAPASTAVRPPRTNSRAQPGSTALTTRQAPTQEDHHHRVSNGSTGEITYFGRLNGESGSGSGSGPGSGSSSSSSSGSPRQNGGTGTGTKPLNVRNRKSSVPIAYGRPLPPPKDPPPDVPRSGASGPTAASGSSHGPPNAVVGPPLDPPSYHRRDSSVPRAPDPGNEHERQRRMSRSAGSVTSSSDSSSPSSKLVPSSDTRPQAQSQAQPAAPSTQQGTLQPPSAHAQGRVPPSSRRSISQTQSSVIPSYYEGSPSRQTTTTTTYDPSRSRAPSLYSPQGGGRGRSGSIPIPVPTESAGSSPGPSSDGSGSGSGSGSSPAGSAQREGRRRSMKPPLAPLVNTHPSPPLPRKGSVAVPASDSGSVPTGRSTAASKQGVRVGVGEPGRRQSVATNGIGQYRRPVSRVQRRSTIRKSSSRPLPPESEPRQPVPNVPTLNRSDEVRTQEVSPRATESAGQTVSERKEREGVDQGRKRVEGDESMGTSGEESGPAQSESARKESMTTPRDETEAFQDAVETVEEESTESEEDGDDDLQTNIDTGSEEGESDSDSDEERRSGHMDGAKLDVRPEVETRDSGPRRRSPSVDRGGMI